MTVSGASGLSSCQSSPSLPPSDDSSKDGLSNIRNWCNSVFAPKEQDTSATHIAQNPVSIWCSC